MELLADRHVFSQLLTHNHKESYAYSSKLGNIEDDIDNAAKLLDTYEKMKLLWTQAKRILKDAAVEKKRCEMRHCGVWDDVEDGKTRLNILHDETRSLLKVKFLIDTKLDELVKVLDHKRIVLETNNLNYVTAMHDTQQYQYCIPGDPIYTKYGFGIIRMYRPDDKMVFCTLPFGQPAAKLWIKLDEVMKAEQARQRAEVLTHYPHPSPSPIQLLMHSLS